MSAGCSSRGLTKENMRQTIAFLFGVALATFLLSLVGRLMAFVFQPDYIPVGKTCSLGYELEV